MSDIHAGSAYDTYQPSPFLLGGLVSFGGGTVSSGQNLVKGDVIGRVATSGELIKSVQTATDGSEIPIGVAAHNCDATSAAKATVYIKGGDLDASMVNFDASFTATEQLAVFDRTPINLVTPE
jgi:hypothetical protein